MQVATSIITVYIISHDVKGELKIINDNSNNSVITINDKNDYNKRFI